MRSKNNRHFTSARTEISRLVLLPLLVSVLAIGAGLTIADRVFTASVQTQSVEKAHRDIDQDRIRIMREHPHSRVTRKEFAYQLDAERTLNPGSPAGENLSARTGSSSGGSIEGVDTSFNARLEDGYTRVESVAVQPDGKTLVGGVFPLVNGIRKFGLARLNSDGSTDDTFNPGNAGPNGSVNKIQILSDAKILICGNFNAYNGISRIRIARLNSDGTLDTNFDAGVGPNNAVFDMQVQPDNRILVAGSFTAFNGFTNSRIVLLQADGNQDPSFFPPTINSFIRKVALQQDGKVIVTGQFNTVGGLTRNGVARLNADGTHDTSFDPLTNSFPSTWAVAVQSDGKIIVGAAYIGGGSLVRLNTDGSLDSEFTAPIAPGVETTVHSIIVLNNGKILVGGFLNDGFDNGYGVVQLNANGSVDSTYVPQLSDAYFLEVFSMALTANGKVVSGGDFYHLGPNQAKHITRSNTDGSVDLTFTPNIEGYGVAYSTVRQPDGKLIVAGTFRKVNSTSRYNLVRLNPDGSIDPSFVGVTDTQILTVALQQDGKVLIGGQFYTVNGVQMGAGARLTASGDLDPTFNPPNDTSAAIIYRLIVQSDGKIIAVGAIDTPRSPNGTVAVYRVNSDGSEDPGFTLTAYSGAAIEAVLCEQRRDLYRRQLHKFCR